MAAVFLASPEYDGKLAGETARLMWEKSSKNHSVRVAISNYSLLNYNCNALWCLALNHRQSLGLTWFAMLHADIVPEEWWIDTLIAEAERHNADFLSVVVPFKDQSGLTSTALSMSKWQDGAFCRLTMQQVRHVEFPETFGVAEAADALDRLPGDLRVAGTPRVSLFANTGCMVCRLDRPWCEKIWFETFDSLVFRNNQFYPFCLSEDWIFSHRFQEHGGRVMSTRKIKVIHRGTSDFHSDRIWGQPRDPSCDENRQLNARSA